MVNECVRLPRSKRNWPILAPCTLWHFLQPSASAWTKPPNISKTGSLPRSFPDLGLSGVAMTSFLPQADFPAGRPRRNRRDDFTRRLVRENTLTTDDLIYPVFITEGQGVRQPVPSMPGVVRHSLDTLLPVAEQCLELGIPVLSLFPAIEPALKTVDGKEAANPDG